MRKNGVLSKSDRSETQVESYHFVEGRYNSMPEVNPAQVVIMGLVTVFIALICLIIIIVLLGKIMTAVTGNKASQTTPAQAPAPAPAAPAAVPAPAAQPGNQQLVAAIAAAIAEDMGEDVDHIKILSIRRV